MKQLEKSHPATPTSNRFGRLASSVDDNEQSYINIDNEETPKSEGELLRIFNIEKKKKLKELKKKCADLEAKILNNVWNKDGVTVNKMSTDTKTEYQRVCEELAYLTTDYKISKAELNTTPTTTNIRPPAESNSKCNVTCPQNPDPDHDYEPSPT